MAMSSEEFNNWVSTIGNIVNQAGQTVGQVYQQVQQSRVNSNNGTNTDSNSMYGSNNNETNNTIMYIGGGILALILGVLIFKK